MRAALEKGAATTGDKSNVEVAEQAAKEPRHEQEQEFIRWWIRPPGAGSVKKRGLEGSPKP